MAELEVRKMTDLLTVVLRFEGREVARVSGKDCAWDNGAVTLPSCPEDLEADEILITGVSGSVLAQSIIQVDCGRFAASSEPCFVDASVEETGDGNRKT